MIILFTGVPGAGKTLNAIKFICEDSQFKDRPVFYHGIRELTLPWQQLDEEEVKSWYELPHGSVVFIDECQSVFPPRNTRQTPPEHVAQLNTHRHLGIDLIVITQHPRLIDTSVRHLVGQHHHFERKYGWTRVKRLIFEKCTENLESKSVREFAQTKQLTFDKKYYDVYKSAEVHTHKKRVPIKLVAAFAFLAALPLYLFYAANQVTDRPTTADMVEQQNAQGEPTTIGEGQRVEKTTAESVASLPLDPGEYLRLYEPRIAGIPHTAPIYDDLVQPVEAPKTYCVSYRRDSVDHCQCYTQQITRISMSYSACKNVVDNRMWDPAYKSQAYSASGNKIDG